MTLTIGVLLLPSVAFAAAAGELDYNFAGRGDVAAISALLHRVLTVPEGHGLPFDLHMVERCTEGAQSDSSESNLCFELLDGVDGKVIVRGTSAIDIAYGAGFYLREYCNMSFAWPRSGGNQVTLPTKWPMVESPVARWRLRDISYGFNVCTESYSQVWNTFNDEVPEGGFGDNWEKFLDWSALSGINLALAYTGQEEVYRKVYNKFGISDAVFAEWSNGPAHLTWSRGQSMHNVGGPLPMSWMKAQWHLQRQILARMRELGMTPILPAFQGNVPPLMAELHPTAFISLQGAHWGGGTAAWLDATDPLFQQIGDALIQEIIADFGMDTDGDGKGDVTEHWYEADGYFAAGDPPWFNLAARRLTEESSLSLPMAERSGLYALDAFTNAKAHAEKAYMAMNATDPDAIWMFQGWILNIAGDNQHDLEIMQGYRAAVPQGRFLVSDMWAEWAPVSRMLAEADVPYLFGSVQNFGGTLFLGMSIEALNNGAPEDPTKVPSIFDTFQQRPGGAGVGAFPEGIDQNPAYFTYLFDAPWLSAPVSDMDGWWSKYALQRYGGFSPSAALAWRLLGSSVYGIDERKTAQSATAGVEDAPPGFWREKAKGGLISAPLMHDVGDEPSHAWYDKSVVFDAWEALVNAAGEIARGNASVSNTLRYDLANVGREVLDRVADARYHALMAATLEQAVAVASKLIEVQKDADALLCTEPSLSMSSWVAAASAIGRNDGFGDFYNRMARAQVTTWLPACRDAAEYAGGVCSMHVNGIEPPLDDYGNKAWGGLVGHYYAGRIRCYADEWRATLVAANFNVTTYYKCIDDLAWNFQQDSTSTKFPICQAPQGDVLIISRRLLAKYRKEMASSHHEDVIVLFV